MVGIACKAVLLLIFPFLGASVVVDSSNATSISAGDADSWPQPDGYSDDVAVDGIADAASSDQPDGYSADVVVDDMASMSLIAPDKGDALPDIAKTFPGCSCQWNEGFKPGWSCENDILAPESMAGDKCCCCTLNCRPEHRCSNQECLMLGVDQAAEVAAEQVRLAKEANESAIPLSLLGGVKATKVRLPAGYCSTPKIIQACHKLGLYPLCVNYGTHASMDRGKPGCGSPRGCDNGQNCFWKGGTTGTQEEKYGYSFGGSNEVKKAGMNPLKFGGTCFYASNGGTPQAISLNGWSGGAWSPSNHKQSSGTKIRGLNGKEWTGLDQDKTGWDTFCVNQKPAKYPRNGYN